MQANTNNSHQGFYSLVATAVALSEAKGGCTLNRSGKEVNHKSGYMVGHTNLFTGHLSELNFHTLAYELERKLEGTADNLFIGGWIDPVTNVFFLDLSEHLQNRPTAVCLAAARGEIAIWDCKKKDSIIITERL